MVYGVGRREGVECKVEGVSGVQTWEYMLNVRFGAKTPPRNPSSGRMRCMRETMRISSHPPRRIASAGENCGGGGWGLGMGEVMREAQLGWSVPSNKFHQDRTVKPGPYTLERTP